jgi:hypothetical protein
VKTWMTLHTVRMDGKTYPPGSLIKVPDEQVDRLQQLRAIAEIPEGEKIFERERARRDARKEGA